MADLNPQIQEISVGTKELRKITLYPLSMADQFKMTDAVVAAFSQFSVIDPTTLNDTAIVATMITMIEENLQDLFKLLLDPEEQVEFTELTNDQFTDIVTIVYEVNYENSIKKLQDLISRVKMVMPKTAPVPVTPV